VLLESSWQVKLGLERKIKFKQIAKIGFGKKNQLNLQCVHASTIKTSYISPNEWTSL
jgi:hypothetical protein